MVAVRSLLVHRRPKAGLSEVPGSSRSFRAEKKLSAHLPSHIHRLAFISLWAIVQQVEDHNYILFPAATPKRNPPSERITPPV